MATTITAPSHASVPRWLMAAVAAVAALAILLGLGLAFESDSDPTTPAVDVTPRSGLVVGSADSVERVPPLRPVCTVRLGRLDRPRDPGAFSQPGALQGLLNRHRGTWRQRPSRSREGRSFTL